MSKYEKIKINEFNENYSHINLSSTINENNNNDNNNNNIKTITKSDSSKLNLNEISTTKIDYRHCKSYPIKEIIPLQLLKNEELYWLVTYDKLIKTKKILKILNLEKNNYSEKNIKIKCMKIEDFEIFFVKGFNKPFVRPNKESFILAKLYLLSIKDINKILNYINKTKEKVKIDNFINLEVINTEYNYSQYMNIENRNNDEDISYPYCYLYYIGNFMNKSMILITNTFNHIHNDINNNENSLIYSLPSSKRLYKLIKLLIKSFPEYSPNYFLEYLIKRNLYKNFENKKNEILKLLSLNSFSVPNKQLLNKVLRETIAGIQTNTSISGSSLCIESNESNKMQQKKESSKRISLVKNNYQNGYKNSLKSNNGLNKNGLIGTINYLSTNQTMKPNNTIRTLKNSFPFFGPSITIPNEINNFIKDRESFGTHLTSSTFIQNRLSNNNLLIKEKNMKKQNGNNIKIKVNLKNNDNKENININNILNKKKEECFLVNRISKKYTIYDSISNKIKKKDKTKNTNNNRVYLTPTKRRKIKYYK